MGEAVRHDYDVIVVGGGAAGLSAGIVAHDAGARVLLVEGQDRLGGSTALSGGWFFAAGTSLQKAKGIVDDTPDDMYDYYVQVNQWRIDPPLVRRLCDEAAGAFEWLVSLGVRFPPENMKRSGMETVARGHQPEGKGAEIAEVLERVARQRGIDIALGNRVTALEQGAVTARGERATAAAIVLATGGFGQNREMIAELYPSAIDTNFSISAPGSLGDGIALGRTIGAQITGHDRGLLIPAASLANSVTGPLDWCVLVNCDGRQFIQKDAYYSVLSAALRQQGGLCYAIFDERTRRSAPADLSFGELLGDHAIAMERFGEWGGLAWRADSIDALAHQLGMKRAVLSASVRSSLGAPPYYAVMIKPAAVAVTACGLRIDADARVLDETGAPIKGIFAAGEATGNVLGEMYIASGNSITNCVVFGRIAGANAALLSRP